MAEDIEVGSGGSDNDEIIKKLSPYKKLTTGAIDYLISNAKTGFT